MKILPWARFLSDLPDETIEDEEGPGFTHYGGKAVLEAIAEILIRCGCEVDGPTYAGDHGWDMHLRAGKRPLWCQVTPVNGWVFLIEQSRWFGRNRYWPEYVDVLRRLGAELEADPRFYDIRWHPTVEFSFDDPGAPRPVLD